MRRDVSDRVPRDNKKSCNLGVASGNRREIEIGQKNVKLSVFYPFASGIPLLDDRSDGSNL